jgi:hypothetical protein
MLNELTATKNEFVQNLVDAGLEVETVAFIPERITPPVAIVRPGATYLQVGTLGGEWRLGLEIDLIAATAGNEMVEENLDALICDLIEALPPHATLSNISAPSGITTGNAEYLSSTATIELAITL